MTDNPFVSQIDSMIESVIDIASNPHVISVVDSLPSDAAERVEAIEKLDPDQLVGTENRIKGLRVATRWFEPETPGADLAQNDRYYIPPPEGSPGRPFPYPTGGVQTGRRPSICASVGAVICGSVGG